MVALSATEILSIVVLCGSFAFGVEALFIGMGGRMMVEYRRSRKKVLLKSALAGLCISACAILTSWFIGTDPPFLALFLAVYTAIVGMLVRAVSGGRGKPREIPHGTITDEELRKMIENRGLGDLVNKKRGED